jgi:hypothetical protein
LKSSAWVIWTNKTTAEVNKPPIVAIVISSAIPIFILSVVFVLFLQKDERDEAKTRE